MAGEQPAPGDPYPDSVPDVTQGAQPDAIPQVAPAEPPAGSPTVPVAEAVPVPAAPADPDVALEAPAALPQATEVAWHESPLYAPEPPPEPLQEVLAANQPAHPAEAEKAPVAAPPDPGVEWQETPQYSQEPLPEETPKTGAPTDPHSFGGTSRAGDSAKAAVPLGVGVAGVTPQGEAPPDRGDWLMQNGPGGGDGRKQDWTIGDVMQAMGRHELLLNQVLDRLGRF